MSARGVAAANSVSANSRGVRLELAKLTSEKVTPPEVTSGTPESVCTPVLQVTAPRIASTESTTDSGRTSLPMTKQALA